MARLYLLYLAVLFGPLSGSAVITLISAFTIDFNVDLTTASLAITVYTIPFGLMQLFSGAIADAFSKKKTLVIGLAMFGLSTIIVGLSPNIEFLFLSRFIQGLFGAFQIPVIIGIIGDSVSEKRGEAFGKLAVFTNLGLAAGPLLAGILDLFFSWRIFFISLGIFGMISALALFLSFDYSEAFIVLSEPFRIKARRTFVYLFRVMASTKVELFAIATMIGFVGLVSTYVFVTTLLIDNGYDQAWASLPVTLAGVVGMFLGTSSGRFVDRFGRLTVIYFGFIIGIIAEILMIALLKINSIEILFSALLMMIIIGVGNVFLQASANTIAAEIIPDLKATVASYTGVLRFLGFAFLPALSPLYIEFGFSGLMLFSIILILIGMVALIPFKYIPSPKTYLKTGRTF